MAVVVFGESYHSHHPFPHLTPKTTKNQDHPKDGPTVYATQSTHKLLAALSQATFIHVRDGRAAIPHGRFNESYQVRDGCWGWVSMLGQMERGGMCRARVRVRDGGMCQAR